MNPLLLALILLSMHSLLSAFPVPPPVGAIYDPATAPSVARGNYDPFAHPRSAYPGRNILPNTAPLGGHLPPPYYASPYYPHRVYQQPSYANSNPLSYVSSYRPEPSPDDTPLQQEQLPFRPDIRFQTSGLQPSRFQPPSLLPPPAHYQHHSRRQHQTDPDPRKGIERKLAVTNSTDAAVPKKKGIFAGFFQGIGSALFGMDPDTSGTSTLDQAPHNPRDSKSDRNQSDPTIAANALSDDSIRQYESFYPPSTQTKDFSSGYGYPSRGSSYSEQNRNSYSDGPIRDYTADPPSQQKRVLQPNGSQGNRRGRPAHPKQQQQQPTFRNTDEHSREFPNDRYGSHIYPQYGASRDTDPDNVMTRRFHHQTSQGPIREYESDNALPPNNARLVPRKDTFGHYGHDRERSDSQGDLDTYPPDRGDDVNEYSPNEPLSRQEAQEMVRLFHRLFESLDNSIHSPSSSTASASYTSSTSNSPHSDLVASILNQAGRIGDDTVRVAVPHARSISESKDDTKHELDRDEMINVDGQHHVNIDDDDTLMRAQAAAARAANLVEEHVPDGRDRERDSASRELKHLDENGAMEGLPTSAPAYGTRKKLLQKRTEPESPDTLLDQISSMISSSI